MMITPLSAEWQRRLQNAQTFLLIPPAEMPHPLMRRALMERALAGYRCFAYQPTPHAPWLIWDRPDAANQTSPQRHHHSGFRYTPREWAAAHGYA